MPDWKSLVYFRTVDRFCCLIILTIGLWSGVNFYTIRPALVGAQQAIFHTITQINAVVDSQDENFSIRRIVGIKYISDRKVFH